MYNLFPTLVYQGKISFDLKDLKQEIEAIQKADHVGQKWSLTNYKNGYTSYGSSQNGFDRLHKLSSTFENLQKKIDNHVKKFVKELGYACNPKDLHMTTFWVNVMPSGAQHTAHIHPNSVISGTFYVDVPVGASSIKFEDPRFGFFMNTPDILPTHNKTRQRFYSIQPKAGDLVLFESWLRHEVPTNTTNKHSKKPRISCSFNYSL